jgi:hypothetical protein
MLSLHSGGIGKWRSRVGDPGVPQRHQQHVPTADHCRTRRRVCEPGPAAFHLSEI